MLSVLSSAKALYVRLQQMGQATNLDAGIFIFMLIYFLCVYNHKITRMFLCIMQQSNL